MLEHHDTPFNAGDFVLTTLDTIPGYDIDEHVGLVTGSTIKISNPIKSFTLKMKLIFGGEDFDFADKLRDARQQAVTNMIDEAKRLSANAIISIRFEKASISPGFIEVYVYGTAIKAMKF